MPRKIAAAEPAKPARAPRAAANTAKGAVRVAAKAPVRTAVKTASKIAPKAASKTASKTADTAPVKAAGKPAARTAAKVVAKAPGKTAARPAPKSAAPKKAGIESVARTAARNLVPAVKRAARKAPAVAAPERAPTVDARPALVRDSFTMPEGEYVVLANVKQACLRAGVDVKKSELLRIGVALLGQLDVPTLQAVLAALPQLKTGRPPAQS